MQRQKFQSSNYLAELPPLLSIDRTAELLVVTRRTIARMIAEGRLRSTKLTRSSGPGGRRLVLRESVEELIELGMDPWLYPFDRYEYLDILSASPRVTGRCV